MDFTALKAELAARGFDYLTDDRLGQYINTAGTELVESDLWPWREQAAGFDLSLSFLISGPIVRVTWTDSAITYELDPIDWSTLATLNLPPSLAIPRYYYPRSNAATDDTTSIYPWPDVGDPSTQMQVYEYAGWTNLDGGSDTPFTPPRYHMLIVDIATRMAYRDADDHQAAEALQVQIARSLDQMRVNTDVTSAQGRPTFIDRDSWW